MSPTAVYIVQILSSSLSVPDGLVIFTFSRVVNSQRSHEYIPSFTFVDPVSFFNMFFSIYSFYVCLFSSSSGQ